MLNNRGLYAAFWLVVASGFSTFSQGQAFLDGPVQTDIRPADVVHWQAIGGETYTDGRIRLDIRLTTEQEFTIYEDKLTFKGPAGYDVIKVIGPKTKVINDPISRKDVAVYSNGEFQIHLAGLEPHKGADFPLTVKFIACTNNICLFPYEETFQVPVFAAAGGMPSGLVASATISTPDVKPTAVDGDWQSQIARDFAAGTLPLGLTLVFIFIGGILTNLTPCVYPMIPITMRVLARQGHAPITSAVIYALGIVLTYTSLGLLAASTGTMFGSIMASTTFNVVFAGVMIIFGLGMLGYGNFAAVQTLGNRFGAGKPSFKNTLLLGVGAGLVASPCTGPILAALLAYTAKTGDMKQGAALLLIYSIGFALPYVFLGGSAAKITQVKVSPLIQLITKVIFAAVMVTLALYYLRIPAYKLLQPLGPHYLSVALVTGVIGTIIALVVLKSPKLQNNKHLLLVPTLLLGVSLFAWWQYMTTASHEPSGAKVEWIHSEADGFAAAKASGKPMLIDAWAEWCAACKEMDVTTFVDPAMVEELNKNWVAIKLDLTEINPENDAVIARLGIGSLPTLTLVPTNGDLTKRQSVIGYVNAEQLLQHLQKFGR